MTTLQEHRAECEKTIEGLTALTAELRRAVFEERFHPARKKAMLHALDNMTETLINLQLALRDDWAQTGPL